VRCGRALDLGRRLARRRLALTTPCLCLLPSPAVARLHRLRTRACCVAARAARLGARDGSGAEGACACARPQTARRTSPSPQELEAAAKHDPLFEQDLKWLAAPLGTKANPVQVTSTLASRIVGATDVDDDSIIHWGLVEEGKPPVQIGEEFFVLSRVADAAGEHAHGAGHH